MGRCRRQFLCIPTYTTINNAIALVTLSLVVRVNIVSHTVLKAIVETKVKIAPEVQLEIADQLILQIL